MAAETLVAVCMAAILLVACGGGGITASPTYMTSAGVGEVLQISVDGANMAYVYTVIDTSYPASGITPGQTGSGLLLGVNHGGSYNLGPSLDGFITSGTLLPLIGNVAGHLAINNFGSSNLPVFGIANPTPSLLIVNGTYNYQGFSCNTLGISNAASAPSGTCVSQYGSMTIAEINPTTAAYTNCIGGDITNQAKNPCTSPIQTGTIVATSALLNQGVYNLLDSNNNHVGWFFASMALNGQMMGVIDRDDKTTPAYGHMVLSAYASLVPGTADGNYFVNNNEGNQNQVTITTLVNPYPGSGPFTYTTSYTSTANPGVQGTLTLDTPWLGLGTYYFPASGVIPAASGVVMVSANQAYSHVSSNDPALFATGALENIYP